MLSDALRPKSFSGLFSAAPSVALASLALTAVMMGATKASQSALAMVVGAVGMVAFCAAAALLEKKLGAVATSAIAWLSWGGVSAFAYWMFLA
jgi:hypothetical protein